MSNNIQQTLLTPGWKEIREKAERRVKEAHYAALTEQDPAKYPELHRIAWATTKALDVFLSDLEAE